jgi:acyl-CoA thioesterase
MARAPFFRIDEQGRFVPGDICRGPWDRNSLHGRVVAGLLAHEIESRRGDPAFHMARLTVDLYRMPPFAPAEVSSRVVRDGNRIRVVDAEFTSEGKSIGRASAVLLRRAENPEGTVWSPPPWQVPGPAQLASEAMGGEPMWDMRPVDPWRERTGPKRAWLRENRPLAEGVELTPLTRAALAADFTNPFANWGSAGLQFVNADITLYLHRLPAAEWLGFEVTSHHASDGIAVAECALYDEDGAIGRSIVCAVANRRAAAAEGSA